MIFIILATIVYLFGVVLIGSSGTPLAKGDKSNFWILFLAGVILQIIVLIGVAA